MISKYKSINLYHKESILDFLDSYDLKPCSKELNENPKYDVLKKLNDHSATVKIREKRWMEVRRLLIEMLMPLEEVFIVRRSFSFEGYDYDKVADEVEIIVIKDFLHKEVDTK